MPADSVQSIVVVCALQFERAQCLKAGLDAQFEIECCGPGSRGVMSWARQHATDRRPVVLAGLAGGLTDAAHVGEAFVISAVHVGDGTTHAPTLQVSSGAARATVSCPHEVLTTPEAKRDWRAAHHTELIDLESEAFALAMSTAGRRWAIVRGVSDGVDDELPAAMVNWVDEQGRTRSRAVAMSMLKNPRLTAVARRIGKQATDAMRAVVDVLARSRAPL